MPVGRSSALTRAWKLVGDPYTALATAVQSAGDKASAVEKVLNDHRKVFNEVFTLWSPIKAVRDAFLSSGWICRDDQSNHQRVT